MLLRTPCSQSVLATHVVVLPRRCFIYFKGACERTGLYFKGHKSSGLAMEPLNLQDYLHTMAQLQAYQRKSALLNVKKPLKTSHNPETQSEHPLPL